MKSVLNLLLAVTLSSLMSVAWAAGKAAKQPILLEADHVMIDDQQKISVYTGNVKISQGDMRMSADKVSVYGDKQRLQRMVAEGKPVRFSQDGGPQGPLRGSASRAEYRIAEQYLSLTGGAELWQGNSQFSGGRIEFNLKEGVVKAGPEKKSAESERVRVVIQPEQMEGRGGKGEAKP